MPRTGVEPATLKVIENITFVNRTSYFNELYDENGRIRSHYAPVYSQWNLLSISKRQQLFKKSDRFFSGDYRLDPLPRIITQAEFAILKEGVQQRAEAILAFLCDYYGGGNRWKGFISPSTLEIIICRNQIGSVFGKLKPQAIAFPYGPDIIRDRNGRWRIVEDSAGMLGGMGDLLAARQALHIWKRGYKNILNLSCDPMDFFNHLSIYYQKRAQKKQGIALLYLPPFEQESDHETRRLSQIFESIGIECVVQSDRTKRLAIESNGIYLRSSLKKKRVGYLILRSAPEEMDRHCLAAVFKSYDSKVSKQLKSRLLRQTLHILREKSLRSALLKQRAWTNFSPGVEFLNDKHFGIHVDSLIRFYLKKDPILESIPARALAYRNHHGRWCLDRRFMNAVIQNKSDFVIKRVDEDGGQGVWIGQKHTRRQWEGLKGKIQKDPGKFIVQKFEHLSVLENRIVDLRIHAHVDYEKVIISNSPWGRANWIHDNGKVNLRSNGFTSPVMALR